MSQKSPQSKSKRIKFFNIDKEAKKFYPNLGSSKRMTPLPVYVHQRLSRNEMRYIPNF